MIGFLFGKIIVKQPPIILLDVNGVGYEVAVSMNTVYKLPAVEQSVTLHTHFIVREDAQLLYGFYDLQERALFRTLIKVNGVGPKLALTILSSIDPDSFAHCVYNQDTASLVKLPGVGKKTAERLVIEMRDRLADQTSIDVPITAGNSNTPIVSSADSAVQDAIKALVALGYKPQQAIRALDGIDSDGRNSAELIREALRSITEVAHGN